MPVVVSKQNIETGMSEAVGALHQSYPNEQDVINSIIGHGGYSELNLPSDVQTIINNQVLRGSITDSLYRNLSSEAEQAATGFVLDLGETALKSQKGLSLVITREVKLLIAQGFTIEQAMVKVTESGSLRLYVDKVTGLVVSSETVLSETTHVPLGKILAGGGKMLSAYGMYEAFKSPVADAYNATTGAGSVIDPLKSYAALGVGTVVGGLIGGTVTLGTGGLALLGLATAGVVGAVSIAVTKTALDALPDIIDTAKAAGKSLSEVYDLVSDLIADKISEAFDATGVGAENLLNDVDGYISGLADGISELADDYGWALSNPGALLNELPQWMKDVLGKFFEGVAELPPSPYSPLVFDLDGDGIELSAVNGTGAVYFDLDNDGFAERAGWVTGGDGLLALDRNGNGTIDAQNELFGDTASASNGFENLKALDSNGDNKITSADGQWNNLRMWVDANADGVSQAAELKTLASLGITSINLAYSDVSYTLSGNQIRQESTFVRSGVTRPVVDAWFAYDRMNSEYVADYTLDVRTLFLPTLRGYGDVKDLHIAMSQDETLLNMVTVLANASVADIGNPTFNYKGKMQAMIERWAGVDAVSTTGNVNFNVRNFAEMKKFTGVESLNYYIPNFAYTTPLQLSMKMLTDSITGRFMAQTAAFSGYTAAYNAVTDQFDDGMGVVSFFARPTGETLLAGTAGATNHVLMFGQGGNDSLGGGAGNDRLYGGAGDDWLDGGSGHDTLFGDDGNDDLLGRDGNDILNGGIGNDHLQGDAGDDVLRGDAGNDHLSGGDGNDSLNGGAENDNLYGGASNDTLNGETGNDYLSGDAGDDVLNGGAGQDSLAGNAGNDTYVFAVGDSPIATPDSIRVVQDEGVDTIKLVGVLPQNVYMFSDTGVLGLWHVRYSPTDEILIQGLKRTGPTTLVFAEGVLPKLAFDNGTVWDFTNGITISDTNDAHQLNGGSFSDTLNGNGGNDTLYGGAGNDTLSGGDGNDYIVGSANQFDVDNGLPDNDIIEGGKGADSLYGSWGDDTYVFRAGDSPVAAPDYVMEIVDQGTDTIKLTGGILPSAVTFTKLSSNYWYSLKFGADELRIVNYTITRSTTGNSMYTTNTLAFEKVAFDDGTVLNLADILNKPAYTVTTGNDTVNVSTAAVGVTVDLLAGNDIFTGSNYNDNVSGSDGNDTIEGRGGNDIMNGGNGTDTVTYAGSTAAVTVNLATTAAQNTAGAGSDTITNFENLTGSGFNDTLTGNSNANTIDGGVGNDVIDGAAGNDILIGGTGTDKVTYASATAGVTVSLALTTAQNTIGAGTDTISGFENLTGSSYNDTLTGDANANTIDGGSGNDTVQGGLGNDTLIGGSGTDTVTYASAAAAVTVNLTTTTAQNTVGAGTDTITTFENLTGSNFNDTLTGTSSSNVIEGLGGNDILDGAGGTDTLTYISAAAGVTVNLATTTAQNTVGAGTDTITNFENLTGSNFNDTLTGNSGSNTIEGGAGNDIMNGGTGTDKVTYASATAGVTVNLALTTAQNTLGAGTDTLSAFENLTGSNFNDTLTGNSGSNTIEGGAGNDIMDGGTGTDTVTYAGATAAVTVNLALTTAQNTIGAGTDTITNFEKLTGSGYNDTLRGNTGDNTVVGGSGNDTVYGDAGNDTLYGDSGTDTLFGDAGNDTIYGGSSNDTLYGGTGSDIFKFQSGGGIDTIKDFKTAELDKLDIKSLLSGYDPLTKAITDYIQITTSGTSSIVNVDADGLTGGTVWTQIATLENITGLTDEAALKANGTIIA